VVFTAIKRHDFDLFRRVPVAVSPEVSRAVSTIKNYHSRRRSLPIRSSAFRYLLSFSFTVKKFGFVGVFNATRTVILFYPLAMFRLSA